MQFLANYEKVVASQDNWEHVLNRVLKSTFVGLDTETYGLNEPLFSIILAGGGLAAYFNFDSTPDYEMRRVPRVHILNPEPFSEVFKKGLSNKEITWGIHNAKFDMHKVFNFTGGAEIRGTVWCTKTAERVYRNNLLDYSLAGCAKRRGWKKDDRVEECIKKHKLYTWVQIPGKKKRDKWKHYDKAPFNLISEYGILDGILHRELMLDQLRRLNAPV